MPNITEIVFALNLGDKVVGVTQNCNYPPEAQKKEKIGRESINLEKVFSLNPDLIIMLEDAQKKEVLKLRERGLPVITVNPRTVSEVIDSIVMIGWMTGATADAKAVTDDMKRRIASVEAGIFPLITKKVFMAVGYRPLIGAGGNTFLNDVIRIAGGDNVLQNMKSPYPEINFEELYRLNPQYIIIPKGLADENEILKDRRWERLNAVKNGRILFIDPDILFRPGPRIIEAIEEMAKFLKK